MSKKHLDTSIQKKRTLTVLLVSLCVLIPSFIAVANAAYVNYIENNAANTSVTVELFDTKGNRLFSQSKDEEHPTGESLVNIFLSLVDNMEKTDPISSNVVTEDPIVVKILRGSSTTELTCYFSFTQGASYCTDKSGQYYKIPHANSEFFLASSFAEVLYAEARPPTLSTADGESILPSSADWFYRSVDNSVKPATMIPLGKDNTAYVTSGSIMLSFSDKPDSCNVTVQRDGETIFSGSLDELPTITADTSYPLKVSLRAEWNESAEKSYYGSVSYSFNMLVQNRAEFSISANTVSADGFVVVKATNITDPSKLFFTVDQTDYLPIMYSVDNTSYAAIPCPAEKQDSYSFTVTYGVSSQSFTVTVDDRSPVSVENQLLMLNSLEIELELLNQKSTDMIFLGTSAFDPSDLGYAKVTDYGSIIDIDSKEMPSVFCEYVSTVGAGHDVRAVIGGRILKVADSDTLGKYVIVDSGLGVKLWYFNLDVTDVLEGQYVSAGAVIGKSGKLMLEGKNGFSLMATCYTRAVQLDSVLKAANYISTDPDVSLQ